MAGARTTVAFVDTNVFVYAVGRVHPLREPAQQFLRERLERQRPMATSAEVLQELLHVYLPVGRMETLDAALRLARDLSTVWPIDDTDISAARDLAVTAPGLGARDLLHLAVCRRYGVGELLSFDRALVAAYGSG
jgi:predicted nucleic acid-binding protein